MDSRGHEPRRQGPPDEPTAILAVPDHPALDRRRHWVGQNCADRTNAQGASFAETASALNPTGANPGRAVRAYTNSGLE